MITWLCTNKNVAARHHTHYLFCGYEGDTLTQHAIADHSIRTIKDPGSTDDGLLLLDPNRDVFATLSDKYGVQIHIPTLAVREDNRKCKVITDCTNALSVAAWLAPLGRSILCSDPMLLEVLTALKGNLK